ncbi:hypothetical protein [Chromatocurvus halotolerans]|uniref:Uncharacterized protein n=1 Tax=Chromatocurvus halotolerans TaxID=1132028 RepID=A0A4R2K7N5_9GAMM|nr:hypothetical protein [Chromatocurvus halotolerans]TCO69371.1 hypothetical protein EV688_1343 [Chromatocurvus halotolerans]
MALSSNSQKALDDFIESLDTLVTSVRNRPLSNAEKRDEIKNKVDVWNPKPSDDDLAEYFASRGLLWD